MSVRSNSQTHNYLHKEDDKTKMIFDCNIFSQNGEIESNLVWEIESNATSFNTSLVSKRIQNKNKELMKKDENIYPSEFSTFSYQPKFVKPLIKKEEKKRRDNDNNSSWSQSSKKLGLFPKKLNTGHSLTYIKSLPGEVKLKLQNSNSFNLKEIKVYDKKPNILLELTELSSSLSKVPLKSHRTKLKSNEIEDKENISPGFMTTRKEEE